MLLVSPGQGSERADFGRAWADDLGLFAVASEATGVDVVRLLQRGGPGFARADVLQAAIVAVSLTALLPIVSKARATVGHSLGELTAVALAGALSPQAAVRVAAVRGRAMGEAAQACPGSLWYVDPKSDLPSVLARANAHGIACRASHNPDGWVIAADEDAGAAIARLSGVHRVAVLGPWHHPAMKSAAEPFRCALQRECPVRPTLTWVSAHTVSAETDIVEPLVAQLTAPARWTEALRVARQSDEHVVVAPPSRLAARHAAQVHPSAEITAIHGPSHLAAILKDPP